MPIVKIQVPLVVVGSPAAPLLIYAEGRTLIEAAPVTREILDALHGDRKGCFKAEHKDGHWQVGARVADREW